MADLIDRKAAIEIASGYCHPANIVAELEKLPSAQPEQKTGRWIEEPGMLMCSQCGDVWGWNDAEMVVNFNFCPNCGADMKGANDGTTD